LTLSANLFIFVVAFVVSAVHYDVVVSATRFVVVVTFVVSTTRLSFVIT
jgi:hypothetical protein